MNFNDTLFFLIDQIKWNEFAIEYDKWKNQVD